MQTMQLKLEAYIRDYLQLWDFYGVIQVIRQGEVLFENAYGYASLEFGIRNEIRSRFSLASVSKQFTAFAIMQLYDAGKLDIDRSARFYVPADMPIDESITVHHLLSHTSGLYNYYNFENDFFAGYNRTDYSRDDFFRHYINKKPSKPPGLVYDYNNSNYNLLAWIIEQVSGVCYADYMRTHIFEPLGMTDSDVDDGCKPIQNRSCNYAKDFDKTVKCPYYNEKFSIGAGAIVSNCDNLYKWFMCLRNRRLLSPQAYARFFRVNENRYCYGLEHHRVYGTDCYSHGGDHLGISTYVQHFFDEDLCIIILSNNETIHQYRLGQAIADILHHVEVEAPVRHKEVPMSESELEMYCGTYLKRKIEVEVHSGKLIFTRFAGNLHIELYPVGEGEFVRRHSDQLHPYKIKRNEKGELTFFGYTRESPGS
ncbi:serine hydrolase domain-containing protein [Paenibacillus ginsengarvi]|uniref:Class A beta-lactamase-related serine hydrolase n=1 Tax=Paenibacillus ginsengarvi TaxID=400777 RepID=A0A3B0BD94_9BACL|nr:serine hydrolase domain-containing protein [Paenibacillus ginsengarvi]RKN70642.1 class A beta-lactamase-related serine hydrolase [Paenibacillus ginsengarvi]